MAGLRARPRGGSRANGAKRSGWPPMIASAIGRPSARRARPTAACRPPRPRPAAGPGPAAGTRRAVERRPVRPSSVTCSPSRSGEQQLELLGEQLVVVLQVVAEEREGLDERPAPGHDLRPAAGEQVERREVLEDADRVVGAEHAHRAREPDPLACAGAPAASTTAGAETTKSGRWCSPTPNTSRPTWSASSISSSRSRSRSCGTDRSAPAGPASAPRTCRSRAPSGPRMAEGPPRTADRDAVSSRTGTRGLMCRRGMRG